jgi:cytochrome c551/c552
MKCKKHHALGITTVAMTALFLTQAVPAHCSDEGVTLFQQKCASCHATEQGKKQSIKERNKIQGTPLWFAGSKFQQEWLVSWLTEPTPLLGVNWNSAEKGSYNHPPVSADDAGKISTFLMTKVDSTIEAGKAELLPKKRSQKRKFLTNARALFEKNQGCYSCHRYLNKRNLELGGFSAPTLVTAKDRLQGDWVYSYLENPQKYYPNSKCPVPGDKATNKFTETEKAKLAGYVVNIGVK